VALRVAFLVGPGGGLAGPVGRQYRGIGPADQALRLGIAVHLREGGVGGFDSQVAGIDDGRAPVRHVEDSDPLLQRVFQPCAAALLVIRALAQLGVIDAQRDPARDDLGGGEIGRMIGRARGAVGAGESDAAQHPSPGAKRQHHQ